MQRSAQLAGKGVCTTRTRFAELATGLDGSDSRSYGQSPRVALLDATLDPAELARLGRALLRQAVARRHIQGAI
jgi:hypothetical protein